MKEFSGRKRENSIEAKSEDSFTDENEKDEKLKFLCKNPNYVKMPDKSNFRMRAHCNPLSDVSMN